MLAALRTARHVTRSWRHLHLEHIAPEIGRIPIVFHHPYANELASPASLALSLPPCGLVVVFAALVPLRRGYPGPL